MTAGDDFPELRARALASAKKRKDALKAKIEQLFLDRLNKGLIGEARSERIAKVDFGIAQIRVDLLAGRTMTLLEVDTHIALEAGETPSL